jgi:hypothetical protein
MYAIQFLMVLKFKHNLLVSIDGYSIKGLARIAEDGCELEKF